MGIENGLRLVPGARSPYPAVAASLADFTLGAEAANARDITIQLKTIRNKACKQRIFVKAYLSADANGDALHATPPDSLLPGAAGTVLTETGDGGPGLLVSGALAISAVSALKFKTTATAYFMIGGKVLSLAATDNIVFSAAHVVAANKYGIVLIQVDSAGAVTTKVPGATQTTPMAYADAASALAVLPQPDSGKAALGYITLDNHSNAGTWTANTNNMTNGSGITAAAFVNYTIMGPSRKFVLSTDATGLVHVIITTAAV